MEQNESFYNARDRYEREMAAKRTAGNIPVNVMREAQTRAINSVINTRPDSIFRINHQSLDWTRASATQKMDSIAFLHDPLEILRAIHLESNSDILSALLARKRSIETKTNISANPQVEAVSETIDDEVQSQEENQDDEIDLSQSKEEDDSDPVIIPAKKRRGRPPKNPMTQ